MSKADLRMIVNNQVGLLIDQTIAQHGSFGQADQTRRRYLGGSMIGHACIRHLWYAFHWAAPAERFEGRMLRLFNRGHREEGIFVQCLRLIGCDVEEYDPATVAKLWYHAESDSYLTTVGNDSDSELAGSGLDDVTAIPNHVAYAAAKGVKIPKPKQFSSSTLNGHHKCNADGRARYVPGVENFGLTRDTWILVEFKTHNEKSFANLLASNDGVRSGKSEHWAQMQRYMHTMQFPLALYGAVNKNTDELYWEFVPYDAAVAAKQDVRAIAAIHSIKPPSRLSTSPSWFECKYCIHRPQCHYGQPLEKNCRTCISSLPVAAGSNGDWFCQRWGKMIPHDAEAAGCASFKQRDD